MNIITQTSQRIVAFTKRYLNKRTGAALLVIVAFLGYGLIKGMLSKTAEKDTASIDRQVTVAPAALLSQLESVLETTGEVISQTQGDLRTQSSGIITQVYTSVGKSVSAGTIIASIENASQRASVAQADAGVASAQASFNKVKGGTRDEQLAVLAATTSNVTQALEETQIAAKNTLLSAYAATDAAFIGGVDALFANADGANPQLNFVSTNNSQRIAAEHSRFILQSTLERHAEMAIRINVLDAAAIRNEITTVERDMLQIKSFLDNLISAVDGAVVSINVSSASIASYKVTASSARSSILGTLTSLSSARGALNAAEGAVTVAKENQSQGITGAQEEDVAVAQAQLDAAKATRAQAVAQLEKTRVRAPVSGVVTLLTVDPGDFVASFQDIGLVANEGSLEVVTFLSPNAVERVSIGTRAVIDTVHTGVITSIAPGIDSVKRQVEVHVALLSSDTNLIHGSRVSVAFSSEQTQEVHEDSSILIPISALKLIGSNAFVFSMNSENKLVAHEVTLGAVIQESVEILSGILGTTSIVLDARGLNVGDSVILGNN